MAVKTYEMRMLGYESTFPVMVGEKKEFITFKKASLDEGDGYLHTDKKDIQKAIEASDKFKNGEIKLVKGEVEVEEEDEDAGEETVIREDVTDFQTAREVLLGEPFNLKPQAVPNNPDAILKAAAKAGVSFPNVKAE